MRPDQIAGQDIVTAPVGGGTLARHLLVPGTITPDADRIARVPVPGSSARSPRCASASATRFEKGEVVAVLDSREVADAKSDVPHRRGQGRPGEDQLRPPAVPLGQADLGGIGVPQREGGLLRGHGCASRPRPPEAVGARPERGRGRDARQAGRDHPERLSTLRRYELRRRSPAVIVERRRSTSARRSARRAIRPTSTRSPTSPPCGSSSPSPRWSCPRCKEGARVKVTPGPGGRRRQGRAEGKVVFVSPILNMPETRSARVIVSLPNQGHRLATRHLRHRRGRRSPEDAVTVAVAEAGHPDRRGQEGRLRPHRSGGFREAGPVDDSARPTTTPRDPHRARSPATRSRSTNTFLLKAELGKAEAEPRPLRGTGP